MNQCECLGTRVGERVVIGEHHLHAQLFSSVQGLMRCHSVIDRDDEAHTTGVELIHHGTVQPVAISHPAGDCCLGFRSQGAQGAEQQGCARHAIGVVVATDRYELCL